MALNPLNLQNNIIIILNAMDSIHKNGDEYFAIELSKAIDLYISQGQVNTIDSGVGSAGGVYTGKGTGTMKINLSSLKNKLCVTFTSSNDDYDLANSIAEDINNVCSEQNIISTTTIGQTVLPSSTVPDGGMGRGSFLSNKSTISLKLKSCFDTMRYMSKNGNVYLAQELASAIDNYMKSGKIDVALQSPISGKGVGSIS